MPIRRLEAVWGQEPPQSHPPPDGLLIISPPTHLEVPSILTERDIPSLTVRNRSRDSLPARRIKATSILPGTPSIPALRMLKRIQDAKAVTRRPAHHQDMHELVAAARRSNVLGHHISGHFTAYNAAPVAWQQPSATCQPSSSPGRHGAERRAQWMQSSLRQASSTRRYARDDGSIEKTGCSLRLHMRARRYLRAIRAE